MFAGNNMIKYRVAMQRTVVICTLFACMTAHIIFLLVQESAHEKMIKSLNESLRATETRCEMLTAQLNDANAKIDAMEFEKSISRGAQMHRLTGSEMQELAKTVHAEAQGENSLGKMLVAKVALNRLAWNKGMTLHEILINQGAFATCDTYTKADMDAVRGAMVDTYFAYLAGFHNPETATNPEAKEHKVLLTVGNHVFW